MAVLADIIDRIRSEVGDIAAPFVDSFTGADELSTYDLSETNVNSVQATVTDSTGTTHLVEDTDFVLSPVQGTILLINPAYSPLKHGQTLIVRGTSYGMFSDDELTRYVTDAFNQHTYGRALSTRFRDEDGFIRYDREPITLETLPPVEEPLLAYLAAVNVLWTLATDASTDVDVNTSEGTHVPRSQRYQQLMQHLAELQQRYNSLAAQLNVGLARIEQFQLRRISRTTNRLVPIFEPREYDDASMPKRLLPPIDGEPLEDESGVASPLFPGVWG